MGDAPPETFTVGDDLAIRRLGFGAMRLTGPDIIGPPADETAAKAVIRRALDLGVDFVDTADSYGPGVSERLLGEELDAADDVVVATKAGLLRDQAGNWIPHAPPDYLHNQVRCSLDRLRVEQIDLYQLHSPRSATPFEDSVHALAEMKDAGQVREVGLSNVSVDQLERARDIVDVVTVQNRYNVGNRRDESVLQACEEYDLGFIPWGPMYTVDEEGVREVLADVADAHDATPRQVALAWLLHHSRVTLPIPGTSSVDHLGENLGARDLVLGDEEMGRLDDIAPPSA